MGSVTSIPEKELKDLLSTSAFTKEELNDYYRKFLSISPAGKLNQLQFDELCAIIFTETTSKSITKEIFASFDQNNDGQVCFRELITSLSLVMKGTGEEKLRWLFSIYDLDNDGRITLDEVLDAVESMYATTEGRMTGMGAAQIALRTAEVEHMFKIVDKDSNGYWTLDEFVKGMKSHPAFLKMLKLVHE